MSLVLTVIAATTSTSCGSSTKQLKVAMHGTKSLNQDDTGDPLPVIVRIYQLRSRDKFDQAPFKALWKGDKDLLEGDAVDRKEFMLHPDSNVDVEVEVDKTKGAQFFGVMALFRKPEGNTWKNVFPIRVPWFSSRVAKVRLDEHSVTLVEKE
jgi:type VI secretion system protein VasD